MSAVFLWFIVYLCVSSTPQIISRRSARRAMGTPTRSLTCRFLSGTWEKRACRVQACRGRSRAASILRSHPPIRRCHSIPATRRRRKYPSTRNIPNHRKCPRTLWLHSSPSPRFTRPESHLNSLKVRRRSGTMANRCQLTFILNDGADGAKCSVFMPIQTQ